MATRNPRDVPEIVKAALPHATEAERQAATYQLDCFLDVIDEIQARLAEEGLLDAVLDKLRAGERVDRTQ